MSEGQEFSAAWPVVPAQGLLGPAVIRGPPWGWGSASEAAGGMPSPYPHRPPPGTASHDRAAGLPAPELPETRQRETQHLLDGPRGHMGPFCHIPAVGSQSPSSATLKAGGRAPPFEGGAPENWAGVSYILQVIAGRSRSRGGEARQQSAKAHAGAGWQLRAACHLLCFRAERRQLFLAHCPRAWACPFGPPNLSQGTKSSGAKSAPVC